MAKIIKQQENKEPGKIEDVINNSQAWFLVTVTEDVAKGGAVVAVRESGNKVAIDMIAMLLEQKEIYDGVKASMARVKLEDKKKGNNSPDLNVN